MIVSPGIGSGLDINSLVSQLVAFERAPVEQRLNRQEADVNADLSAFGVLKGALSAFESTLTNLNDAAAFQARKANSSDETFFTASATKDAAIGGHTIEITSLATAHKLASGAFTDSSTTVGTGTLTISVGADSFDVLIDGTNNTVAGIRDAINAASDNTGVTATLLNADDGTRLILNSDSTGAANTINVTEAGGDGGLVSLVYDPGGSGTTNLTQLTAAADAQLDVDGFTVSNGTNTITDAIEGVTLNLLQAQVGNSLQLDITTDVDVAKQSIQDFVTNYNAIVASIFNIAGFDAATSTGGPLLGDSLVRGVESQLRRELSTAVTGSSGSFSTLAEIGITTQLDGILSIDDAALDAALADEFDNVGALFSSTDGYAPRLINLMDSYLDSLDGLLELRIDTLESNLDDISDERVALDLRMEAVEARILAQFTAMDALVSQLQATSDFLTQQLANLNPTNSSTGA